MRLTLLSIGILAAAACGEKAAPPDAAADVAKVDAAPPPPASRLAEATAFFDKPLDLAGLDGALSLATALEAEPSPEAKLAAARIRLVTVARDMATVTGSPSGELKLGIARARAEVEQALTAAGDSPAAKRVALAARAIRRMLGDTGVTVDAREVRALERDPSPEAAAYRLALVASYARMRQVGRDTVGLVVQPIAAIGPFVCNGCGAGITEEIAARPASDGSGLACRGPEDALWCEGLMAVQAKDPVAKLGHNALVVATLELMAKLTAADAAPGDAGLGAALKSLAGALEPVVLPVPVALAEEARRLGDGGTVGLAEEAPGLVVAHVGTDTTRIGLRAVVSPGGALPSAESGVALAEAPALSHVALAEVEPAKESGAITGVSDRLTVVRKGVAKAPSDGAGSLPGDAGVVLLALEPTAPVAMVEKVADGLMAGGDVSFRVLRPGLLGEVLPLHLRSLPGELEAALVPSWEKTMVVVVTGEALDVWAPEGAKEGATPLGPEAQATIPATLQQGWRKDVLARLRVALAPAEAGAERLTPEALSGVAQAVKLFADQAKAGHVVHVVAGEGATLGDVLVVARYLQEVGLEPAPELGRVGEIWPGATCRGEAGCAGAVAVAFSKRAAPSARGLADKPGKAKPEEPKEPAEPKPEPGPAPSAEFCNQRDIKSQMAKKAGSFRFCYERELQLEKDLAGRVVMNFVIGLTGNVRSVRVASSDLGNAKVGECIKKEIGKMQFSAPDGGECIVQWPFKFSF